MTPYALDSMVHQIREFVDGRMHSHRALLDTRLRGLVKGSHAIRQTSTVHDLEETLDGVFAEKDSIEQSFLETWADFEEELFQREEDLLQLVAEAHSKALRGTPGAMEELDDSPGSIQRGGSGNTEPTVTIEVDTPDTSSVTEIFQFLDRREGQIPSLQECRDRLKWARGLRAGLHSKWLVMSAVSQNQVQRATCDKIFEEIAKLDLAVKEMPLLIRAIKGRSAQSPHGGKSRSCKGRSATRQGSVESQRTDLKPRLGTSDEPVTQGIPQPFTETVPGDGDQTSPSEEFRSMTTEQFSALEEDYYHCRYLFRHLRDTDQSSLETRHSLKLQRMLEARREELVRWREDEGYYGNTPRMIAEMFASLESAASHTTKEDSGGDGSGQKQKNRGAEIDQQMRKILRDLVSDSTAPERPRQPGNLNRRVFLTGGRMNPRSRSW